MVDLQTNRNDIAVRYDMDIIVVESSYAFTADDKDKYENVIRFEERPGYPLSPKSQKQMLAEIMTIVRAVPNGRGLGIMGWDTTRAAVPGNGWVPRTRPLELTGKIRHSLFDYDNFVLPAMSLFNLP